MKDCTINQHVDGNGNAFSGSGDVQSNSFASHGGQMNIAQGTNSIGQQINNYGSQPAPPVIPRQLPAPEPCFLHRDEELVWLNERLHPGKVAAQAVSKLEPARFPDGIILHSFYHQPKVETALQAICQAFQVEAKTSLESTVRQVLSGRKALLILDGTEQADDLPAVLRLRGQCGVLITSRKRADAQGVRLDLKPLKEQDAAEVFRAYSGPVSDTESVQGICKILDGWPFALRIAGRYISSTGESAAEYLKWLKKAPFKELGSGEYQEENAALLLRRSVEQVSEDARIALSVAGTLAFAPIAREPVAVILDNDEYRARNALNDLVNFGILDTRESRWQISHALIHTYARSELPLSIDALEGLAEYYISFCEKQSAAGVKGYARLDAERAHCLRLMESCLNSKLWQEVQDLMKSINSYLAQQGYWTEKQDSTKITLTAAQQAGHRKNEGWCLNSLGYTCWRRGEYEQAIAYLEQSLSIVRETNDWKEEAVLLNNIAMMYYHQDKHELALEQYKQSLSMARKIGDRRREGGILNNIGLLYMSKDDWETALSYFEQSLPMLQETGDNIMERTALNNIAEVYRAQGNYVKALEHHEQTLATRCELGDRFGEAESRWNIGLTYINLGDLAKAEEHISLAVQIAEQIGLPNLDEWRDELALVQAARQG